MRNIARFSTLLAIALLISILAILEVAAPPPGPHGVSGTVYYTAGAQEEVAAGTPFVVKNMVNGDEVRDGTGAGPHTGRYSVVIDGNDTDSVTVTAWNSTYWGRRYLNLQGDMRRQDVYLNMTRPSELNLTIMFPADNYEAEATVLFNVTVNITNIGNQNGTSCSAQISLNGTGISLAQGQNSVNSLGGINVSFSAETNFTLNGSSIGSGNFTVNASCTSDGENLDNANRRSVTNISVTDRTPPVVHLIRPLNNTLNNTNNQIEFFYNVSEFSDILNCTLITNNQLNVSNSTLISKYAEQQFVINVSDGQYNWSVNCTDVYGNTGASESFNLTVNISNIGLSNPQIEDPVNLVAGGLEEMQCNASFAGSVTTVNGTLYDTNVSFPEASPNNSSHYFNDSCAVDLSQSKVICGFSLLYYANNGTWRCNINASNGITTDSIETSTKINSLIAINITPPVIDYGGVQPLNLSELINVNVSNAGNVRFDLSLYGYSVYPNDNTSLNCTPTAIPLAAERLNLNGSLNYDEMTFIGNNPDNTTFTSLDLQQRNDTVTWINETYWRLQVPTGLAVQQCNGTIVFTAILDLP